MKTAVLEHPRIASKKRFNDIANTPLWSCLMGGYAAAALKQTGFDTLFIDEAYPNASFEQTQEKILGLNLDLLCVNAVYFWEHTPALFDFLSGLKSQGFSGHINLFGFFPSLVSRQILKACPGVDSIAVGEFEHTLVELAQALEKNQNLEKIQGLALESCLGHNSSRMRSPEKNPDLFAFPQRSSLEGSVSILASRGCYNHCSFCPVPSFYNQGRLWRGRSPQNIAAEIEALVTQGATAFYFCDPNFVGPGARGKKRIMELMDLIKPLNITFGMETRPEDLEGDLLEKLVGAGLESLLMGIESGSCEVLKRMDKRSGPAQSSRAIDLCRDWGLEPEIGFLMFVPDSGLRDLKENMEFLKKNRLLDRLARTANLLSHTQIVLAGTPGYLQYEKKGLLEKSGIFGFEADVLFSDPAVKWVAELLTFACHTMLQSMSDHGSPIFWKNQNQAISQAANDFLVNLGDRLIGQAEEKAVTPDSVQQVKKEILAGIHALVPLGKSLEFHIRPCNPDDLDELQSIGTTTFDETFRPLNRRETMDTYLQESFNRTKLAAELNYPTCQFYFLYVKNTLAGYVKLNGARSDHHGNEFLEIERIYVKKSFKGKGWGKKLLNHAFQVAGEMEKTHVWLGVWEKNIDAISFYTSMGFHRTGEHLFQMGDEVQNDWIMEKQLSPG